MDDRGDGTFGDGCDDCSKNAPDNFSEGPKNNPNDDGFDSDGDGFCNSDVSNSPDLADCDDDKEGCDIDCSRANNQDGDDYCATNAGNGPVDCDDCIDSCSTNCGQDSDSDGEPDCLEVGFCGSQSCMIVNDQASLANAITTSNNNIKRDHILIRGDTDTITISSALPAISSIQGLEVRQDSCSTIEVEVSNPLNPITLFNITGDRTLFENMYIKNVRGMVIGFATTQNTNSTHGNDILHSVIDGFDWFAVYGRQRNDQINGNRIVNGAAGSTGIFHNSKAVYIVGNIVANSATAFALHGYDSDFSHNTAVDNTGHGLALNNAHENCIRNNNFTNNGGAAVFVDALHPTENFWMTKSNRCDVLENNQAENDGGLCQATTPGDCDTVTVSPWPAEPDVFPYREAPTYTSRDFTKEDFYCLDPFEAADNNLLGAAQSLIKVLYVALVGLNYSEMHDFGARQSGQGGCP
jgi:parallel beta-helix repeat protein